MTRGLRYGTAVLLAAACDAGTTTSHPSPPANVVGCYQLALGTWSASHESPDPPTTLILTDSLGSHLLENGRTLLRPWPDPSAMPFDMAWWSRSNDGALDLIFSLGGYVGVRMTLTWNGTAWSGTAEAYTDVQPSTQATASATLTGRSCGS